MGTRTRPPSAVTKTTHPPPDAETVQSQAPAPRRARRRLLKLAVVAVATVACLGVVEAGFWLLGYRPIYAVYSKPDIFSQHDPALGWSLKPGSSGRYVGPAPYPIEFREWVRINSLGLRGPEVDQVPAGGRRVLVLGDSQVAGFEVAEERTYSSLLQARLTDDLARPVQVVNAGVRGYGTDQAYLLYRSRLRSLRPDAVVFHATPNDEEDNTTLHRMRRLFGKPAFRLDPNGALRVIGTPVPRYPPCSAYRVDAAGRSVRVDGTTGRMFCWIESRLADHSAFLSFLSARLRRNPEVVNWLHSLGTPEAQTPPVGPEPAAAPTESAPTPSPPAIAEATDKASACGADDADYTYRITSALICRMADEVHQDGARFVLIIDDVDLQNLDRAAFERKGVTIVRTEEARARELDAVFPNDGHMTAVGHERLADHVAPALERVLVG